MRGASGHGRDFVVTRIFTTLHAALTTPVAHDLARTAAAHAAPAEPVVSAARPRERARRFWSGVPMLIKVFLFVDLSLAALYPVQEHFFGDMHNFLADFFDLDQESNAPAWWSSFQLSLTGLLLAGFAWHMFDRRDKRSWMLIGAPLMFLFLSLDEAAMIHESLGRKLDALVDLTNRRASLLQETGVWMLFCGPLLVAAIAMMGWAAAKYFRGRKRIATMFITGFALLVGASTGVELLSNFVGQGIGYTVETLIEETGELLGETVLLWAALELLKSYGIVLMGKSPDLES